MSNYTRAKVLSSPKRGKMTHTKCKHSHSLCKTGPLMLVQTHAYQIVSLLGIAYNTLQIILTILKEVKIRSRQNSTLCYKWQIQTSSLSKCQSNMLSYQHFIPASARHNGQLLSWIIQGSMVLIPARHGLINKWLWMLRQFRVYFALGMGNLYLGAVSKHIDVHSFIAMVSQLRSLCQQKQVPCGHNSCFLIRLISNYLSPFLESVNLKLDFSLFDIFSVSHPRAHFFHKVTTLLSSLEIIERS